MLQSASEDLLEGRAAGGDLPSADRRGLVTPDGRRPALAMSLNPHSGLQGYEQAESPHRGFG